VDLLPGEFSALQGFLLLLQFQRVSDRWLLILAGSRMQAVELLIETIYSGNRRIKFSPDRHSIPVETHLKQGISIWLRRGGKLPSFSDSFGFWPTGPTEPDS
jgi:hypothetical protein